MKKTLEESMNKSTTDEKSAGALTCCPGCVVKRMTDSASGGRRFELEVPDDYETEALELDRHRGGLFLIHGPFENFDELERAMADKRIIDRQPPAEWQAGDGGI